MVSKDVSLIRNSKCEICGDQAKAAIVDNKTNGLRYSCLNLGNPDKHEQTHYKQLWDKMKQEGAI